MKIIDLSGVHDRMNRQILASALGHGWTKVDGQLVLMITHKVSITIIEADTQQHANAGLMDCICRRPGTQ